MSNEKAFVWAQGEQANLKEPIDFLKQNGWSYGDTPAASNFNWMFKTITENVAKLNKDILSLNNTISELGLRLNSEINALTSEVDNAKKQAHEKLGEAKKAIDAELAKSKKDFTDLNNKALNEIAKLKENNTSELLSLRNDLGRAKDAVNQDLLKIKEEATATSTRLNKTTNDVAYSYRKIGNSLKASKQICKNLLNIEMFLKRLDSNYSFQRWPFRDVMDSSIDPESLECVSIILEEEESV